MISRSGDDLDFELVSILTKDPLTGLMYSPMRMIASRKSTGARLKLFERFIKALHANGLQNPLEAPLPRRLTLATDFETTFSLALGHVMKDVFLPHSNLSDLPMRFIEKVCFGCSVHAKRIILDKCGNDKHLYHWLVGTRIVESAEEVEKVLEDMRKINVHLWHFSDWLRKNKVAIILWFWKRYKSTTPGVYRRILWTTNISESEHAILKGSSDYLLTKSKGLDLVKAIQFLEKHDL